MARLTGDEAFSFNPPLSAQGGAIAERQHGPVAIAELFRLHVGTI